MVVANADTQALREAYRQELKKALASGQIQWPDTSDSAIEVCVNKMMKAIREDKYPSDWLKYNPALRAAARTVGLKTSPELREFVKAAVE